MGLTAPLGRHISATRSDEPWLFGHSLFGAVMAQLMRLHSPLCTAPAVVHQHSIDGVGVPPMCGNAQCLLGLLANPLYNQVHEVCYSIYAVCV